MATSTSPRQLTDTSVHLGGSHLRETVQDSRISDSPLDYGQGSYGDLQDTPGSSGKDALGIRVLYFDSQVLLQHIPDSPKSALEGRCRQSSSGGCHTSLACCSSHAASRPGFPASSRLHAPYHPTKPTGVFMAIGG
jgi:hypothetical protein